MMHRILLYRGHIGLYECVYTVIDIRETIPVLWHIIASDGIHKAGKNEGDDTEIEDDFHISSCDEVDSQNNGQNNHECTQIRLEQDKRGRDDDDTDKRDESLRDTSQEVLVLSTEDRYRQDKDQFQKLGRLEREGKPRDIEPSAGTVDLHTEDEDQYEHDCDSDRESFDMLFPEKIRGLDSKYHSK